MELLLIGFLHPLHGADHVVAMLAVGLRAVQGERRAGCLLAATFAGAMPVGALAGLPAPAAFGLGAAMLEAGVAVSTLAVAAACLVRPLRQRAFLLLALAGLLHGLAHGRELDAASATAALPGVLPGVPTTVLPFLAGMTMATLLLHLAGAALGRLLLARWLSSRLAPTFLGSGLLVPQAALAQPAAPSVELDTIEVMGNYDNAVGTSDAASAGRVTSNLLSTRPLLRPAEVLEYVPGLIVTQHSGDGKANQYFLRGFNLDHGTDFATHVDGMPVNLPTHAHGHGYTDLNFLIPELIDTIDYGKGPYRAASGDFASAGTARIRLKDRLSGPTGTLTVGENGYRRLFAGHSLPLARAGDRTAGPTLLVGAEVQRYDGPWTVPQDHSRGNAVVRLSDGTRRDGWSGTLMGYDARWTATDQVAQRAVDSGAIGRFGSLDPTSGGRSSRYSASGNWRRSLADGSFDVTAYAMRYSLDLFSNFTYFLDDPEQGDQFEQRDRRNVFGLTAGRLWHGSFGSRPMTNELGLQTRHDRIAVGLFDTVARERTATTRDDRVRQQSYGLYWENGIEWHERLRSVAGVRADRYRFDVAADLPGNSGKVQDSLVSPKLSLIAGPWTKTETFVNWGRGFHSNDARGTVTRFDPGCLRANPLDDCAVTPVPGLVRSTGYEVGVRSEAIRGLQSSLSLWRLDIGSELVFVGDAGTTEPSRPSRRHGIEFSNRYLPRPWLLVDLDLAWSHAKFTDDDPAGNAIPGAVDRVGSLAVTVRDIGPWSGTFALRHLGSRPLLEDGSVVAPAFTLASLRIGYRFSRQVEALLDVFNLFDRQAADIEYFYESRLRNEPAAVADRHFHPVEPRTIRLSLRVTP